MMRAVRGATTVEADDPGLIQLEVARLLEALVVANDLTADNVVSILFTVTDDITTTSPPRVARFLLNWHEVPMMCAQEAKIEDLCPRCIRVLIHFETERLPSEIHPIYLNQASQLRPDLS